jgi:hypothetical protein
MVEGGTDLDPLLTLGLHSLGGFLQLFGNEALKQDDVLNENAFIALSEKIAADTATAKTMTWARAISPSR